MKFPAGQFARVPPAVRTCSYFPFKWLLANAAPRTAPPRSTPPSVVRHNYVLPFLRISQKEQTEEEEEGVAAGAKGSSHTMYLLACHTSLFNEFHA